MKCSDAATLLNKLQLHQPPERAEEAFLSELVRYGHVVEVQGGDGDGEELAQLKQQLSTMTRGRAPGSSTVETAEESGLRVRILDLAEDMARSHAGVEAGGRRYAVTYQGRTLLGSLMTRLARVESMELSEFQKQMDSLQRSLAGRSEKAFAILKDISRRLQSVDEIHLRNAAVGLSARAEPAEALADGFVHAMRALWSTALPRPTHEMLAEAIVSARGPRSAREAAADAAELAALADQVLRVRPPVEQYDYVTAAALLMPIDPALRTGILEGAAAFAGALGATGTMFISTTSAWVLASANGLAARPEAVAWVQRMHAELRALGATPAEAEMAAGILGASGGETGGELVFQFNTARSYLTRLSDAGMVVPAAMLAVLPTGIDETLDDLRMASSQVSLHKLSLGGVENLSLGLKLLMQTAVLASQAGASGYNLQVGPEDASSLRPLGLPGLAMVVPASIVAMASFHELTLHRIAVSDYTFHPVHTSYIYG